MRTELLEASDAVIEDAIGYAHPMVLRGILYQLTGDPELEDISLTTALRGYYEYYTPAKEVDVVAIRRKAVDFLKRYRDSGAGPIDIGPRERLPISLALMFGQPVASEHEDFFIQDLAIDPWARGLKWQQTPDPKRLADFSVTVIGAGLGGLNAAAQLKKAGIRHTVIEKNAGVGGTWYENRYPGARVDTPSRSYTNVFGVDFNYPNPYCEWTENERYFNWVADEFGVRENITFNTEVRSLVWDEDESMWTITMDGPDGRYVTRSNAVITAVGFLSRPNIPDLPGASQFEGLSWHTARWPQGMDLSGKRVAVIGTGCTGYQMIPELAREAAHLTVFQRTPQWVFPVPGYTEPFPPQISWLDRNLPFHTNFMRAQSANTAWFTKLTTIDPEFDDPHACNAMNKMARDVCVNFLNDKIADPELAKIMTPKHPVWSARAVVVDPQYGIFDAIQRDNTTLVTSGIKQINARGIEDQDGIQHDADIIVYATGFRAADYFYPMEIRGRGGMTVGELWGQDGPKAYRGCMMPGFPNFWSIYGPNTNGGLGAAAFHEMIALFAMKCIEQMFLTGKTTVEVKKEPYVEYNELLDRLNLQRVWSDKRADNYYWTHNTRTAVQCPFTNTEIWSYLNHPQFEHLEMQ